jgi:hypothetical protein
MVQTSSSQSPDQWPHSGRRESGGAIVIACAICDASFTFAPDARRLQLSAETLETVYMSVCHFCFRCRGLSCPQCWDALHGLCGSCVRETDLPFRDETTPLPGVSIPRARRAAPAASANPSSSALLCVRPGNFQPGGTGSTSSAEYSTTSAQVAWPYMLPTAQTAARQDERGPIALFHRPPLSPHAPGQGRNEESEEEEVVVEVKPIVRFITLVEQLVTAIAFVLLILVLLMIVLAELSPLANFQIGRLLHVDIRGEIAYLTYLVRQLRW